MKNKRKIYLFLFLTCSLPAIFAFTENSSAIDRAVSISAVQTGGSDADEDFIELYNPTCEKIDISDWKLRKKTSSGTESSINSFDAAAAIPAKGFFLWGNSTKGFSDSIRADEATGASLSDNYSIALFDGDDHIIDSITWGENVHPFEPTSTYPENPKKSESLLKNSSDGFFLVANYAPKNSTSIGSDASEACPGGPGDTSENKTYSGTLTLNEILPYPPSGDEEFIELYNPEKAELGLSGWTLRDASKNGKYVFPEGASIGPRDYLVLYKKDFKFALNNSGTESVTLRSPDGKIVSAVDYKSANQAASYNFDGKNWRWSKFLTPGAENTFNNLPEAKTAVPKKVYKNTYAEFSAQGSDKDKDKLKYAWNFGDGHKSYLQKTRHKYEKTGRYTVSLKISDGSEDKIDTFKIEVEKFPELDVKIVGLSPNPDGADTGKEYLEIKNTTKKKINLKNWSIRSGTKKLANHPITEDFFIKDGKTARITYAVSKFTLPNTKGKIELRYPNGKTASHVNYGDKKKNIAEDAAYVKAKSGWKWIIPTAKTAANTPPTAAAEIPTPILPAENILAQPEPVPTIEEKDLGQSSPSPDWENKQKTRFSFINFGLHISTAQAFVAENPRLHPDYSFENFPARKHWAIALLENLNIKINSFLNKITLAL
ncbi:MAG: lamin tail domain-containing protein [Candidatus Moranbacteria bacterium]|nr:lamin tail domain-containing protein [Candidatus Moranbacteria bacterium]